MDSLSKEHRSWNMSRIRSKNTTPERAVRSFLFHQGFRFRLHDKKLPGHPDIVLPKFRTIIEVRGCFWHRHPGCKNATMPSTNTAFWKRKLSENMCRDSKNEARLKEMGWTVIVIWECELSDSRFIEKLSPLMITRRDAS